MPIDLPPVPVVEDAVNDVAVATVGRPPLLDTVNDALADPGPGLDVCAEADLALHVDVT